MNQMGMRVVLSVMGVALTAYGAWILASRGREHLEVAIWLAAGVLIHDVVLALGALVVGVVVMRALPAVARGPVAVGLVVLTTVTVTAIPVLGRFGERPDNPTLLPRDYTQGWLVLAGIVVVVVSIRIVLATRSPRRREEDDL